jgi:ABC-type bacteriocin/lantibiotic exporter with double-glycine peptidase domain
MQSVSLAVPHFEQEKTYSCTAACVRMVLNYYGLPVSEDDVRVALGTKTIGTRFTDVAEIVPSFNLNLELGAFNLLQLNRFITSQVPPIIFLRAGLLDYWTEGDEAHTVVLTAFDANARTVNLNDPVFSTPQQTSIDRLNAAWQRSGNLTALLRQR